MPATRRTTEAEIIKADEERVRQAIWLAMCEMCDRLDKWAEYGEFERWTHDVNKRAVEIFARLQ